MNPNPGAEVKVLQLHIQRRRPYGRIVATGLVIFMATLLLLTQSRGAYLATATALGLLGVLRWRRLFALLPIFAIGVGITIYQLGWSRIFDLLGSDNTFGGAGFRTVIWHADQRALHDFFWTGIGLGRFTEVMRLLYPSPIIQSPSATHAHNLLLQIGLDLGGPGLLAWLGLYLTLIGMTIAVLRRTASPTGSAESLDATWDGTQFIAPPHVDVTISTRRFVRRLTKVERRRQQQWLLAAGCLAALVGIQIHGLLDAVTWGNKLAFIPWLLFALVTLLYDSTSPSTAQSPVTSDKQSHPLHPKYGDLHTPIDPTMNP
ncbi:MAG: O-antigen ligase family protein [Caldilineaceae bacterium]